MNEVQIATKLKEWLGPDGINHFQKIKAKYGEINVVWMEGSIPHSVHLREGMQVRNKLRNITECSYSDSWYDDNWVRLVELCLE